MSELNAEIQAYEQMRSDLEADHMGKWVVIHGHQRVGVSSDSGDPLFNGRASGGSVSNTAGCNHI